MNTDGHRFYGAEKQVFRCCFQARFGGSSLTRQKLIIALSYPRLSASICGSNCNVTAKLSAFCLSVSIVLSAKLSRHAVGNPFIIATTHLLVQDNKQ
jgi:hypothetical protein